MKLVFATHNKNKLREVKSLMPSSINLLSLTDIDCQEEIPETSATIAGNAMLKARFVYKNYNLNCFADDSGLEVEALQGKPGVHSARYAGEQKHDEANIQKVLKELDASHERKALFRTVIALIIEGKEYSFEGVIHGNITGEKRGSKGFGYDPVFIPEGFSETFAQMDAETKNSISHRGIAVKKLIEFLRAYK